MNNISSEKKKIKNNEIFEQALSSTVSMVLCAMVLVPEAGHS